MLVIKLEIWPWGSEANARELGRCTIANVTKDPSVSEGDYEAQFFGSDAHFQLLAPVKLRNWPRLEKSPWELLAKVIGLSLAKQKKQSIKASMLAIHQEMEAEVAAS